MICRFMRDLPIKQGAHVADSRSAGTPPRVFSSLLAWGALVVAESLFAPSLSAAPLPPQAGMSAPVPPGQAGTPPASAAADAVERGRQLLSAGASDESLLWLERALAQGSTDPRLPYLLGQALRAFLPNRAILLGHTAAVVDGDFDPQGQRVATASEDRTVRIFDVQSGRALAVLTAHPNRVTAVRFSRDGKTLVTQCADGLQRSFDARTYRLISSARIAVAFARFPGYLAPPVDEYAAKQRRWTEEGDRKDAAPAHRGPLRQVVRSEDNRNRVSTSDDGTARLWVHGATDWRQQAVFFGHRGAVLFARFSRDMKAVLTGGADGTARIYSTQTVAMSEAGDPSGAGLHVEAVRWHDSQPLLTILRSNQILTQWDAVSARETLRQSLCTRDMETLPALGPQDSHVLVPNIEEDSDGEQIASWENPSATPRSLRLKLQDPFDLSLPVFGPRGGYLFLARKQEAVVVASPTGIPVLRQPASAPTTLAVFDADERFVLIGHQAPTLYRLSGTQPIAPQSGVPLQPQPQPLRGARFAPQGNGLMTYDQTGRLQLWDPQTGRLQHTIAAHRTAVNFATYTPNGAHIVTASADGTARIFSPSDGQPRATLVGHTAALTHVDVRRDGQRIVTSSIDGTVRIWDFSSGEGLAVLSTSYEKTAQAEWSADGHYLYTTDLWHSVLAWNQSPYRGSPALLRDVLQCHVGRRLEGDRSVSQPPDTAACQRLHAAFPRCGPGALGVCLP